MSEKKKSSIDSVIEQGSGLKRSIKTKDVVMIGVGGTIGTGLFLSSGWVLQGAGPGGTLVAYLFGGLVMWLMMQCLGELSTAIPVSGSMQAYATKFINPAMGFTIGWVNWLGAALTITAQIVASAIIMKNIIPSVDTTIWVIVFTLLLFGVNALSAKQYGETSFWFASLKLVLIVVFAIVGVGMILGVVGGEAVGFGNYTTNGGLFPTGFKGILVVMITAMYAYGGSELFASSAGEIEDEKQIPKAVNATVFLLIAAYIVSMIVLIALLPWEQADLQGCPFAYVFKHAGIGGAELIVNVIVLTSALTSGNYFVYGCTRYLWSLAKFNQAPQFCAKTDKRGVPMNALILTMIFAALSIVSSFVAEDTVYLFLIYLIGGGNIFMYSTICICQYRFRHQYIAEGGKIEDLRYKVNAFPLVPILGVLAYVGMLIGTLLDPTEAIAIYICAPSYLVIYLAFHFYTKKKNVKAANINMD